MFKGWTTSAKFYRRCETRPRISPYLDEERLTSGKVIARSLQSDLIGLRTVLNQVIGIPKWNTRVVLLVRTHRRS